MQSNRLRYVGEIDQVRSLQRLYLHSNRLGSLEDVRRIGNVKRILDVTIHPNPVTYSEEFYRLAMVAVCRSLKRLDGYPVSGGACS